jgi:hypothetical protein
LRISGKKGEEARGEGARRGCGKNIKNKEKILKIKNFLRLMYFEIDGVSPFR